MSKNKKATKQMGFKNFLTIDQLVEACVTSGIYLGPGSKRNIRLWQTQKKIPQPIRVKNPNGRGMIVLYPPETVEIIRKLRIADVEHAYAEAKIRAEAAIVQRDARLAAFGARLDEWMRNGLSIEERGQLLVDVEDEYVRTGRVLPGSLLKHKLLILRMPTSDLGEIVSSVFYGTPGDQTISEWTNPSMAHIYNVLSGFQDVYTILSGGNAPEAFGDLRFNMYIAWIAQADLARRYRKKSENTPADKSVNGDKL